MTVIKSQESLAARARGRGGMQRTGVAQVHGQEEKLHLLATHMTWRLTPEKASKQFPGQSNAGVVMGPFDVDDWASEWKGTLAEKKTIYQEHRKVVPKASGADDDAAVERSDETLEPMFWHSMPKSFFEEVKLRLNAEHKGFIDLAMGNCASMMKNIEDKTPFLGFALSEQHAEACIKRAEMKLLKEMLTPGGKHYVPRCTEVFGPLIKTQAELADEAKAAQAAEEAKAKQAKLVEEKKARALAAKAVREKKKDEKKDEKKAKKKEPDEKKEGDPDGGDEPKDEKKDEKKAKKEPAAKKPKTEKKDKKAGEDGDSEDDEPKTDSSSSGDESWTVSPDE